MYKYEILYTWNLPETNEYIRWIIKKIYKVAKKTLK